MPVVVGVCGEAVAASVPCGVVALPVPWGAAVPGVFVFWAKPEMANRHKVVPARPAISLKRFVRMGILVGG